MTREKQIAEMERNRRLSVRAIPTHAFFLLISILTLWILSRFFTLSPWVFVIVIGMTAFTLLGDIWNYYYCGRQLKNLKQHEIT